MENIECAAGSHFNSNIELRITSGSEHLGTSRVRDLIGNCHHIFAKIAAIFAFGIFSSDRLIFEGKDKISRNAHLHIFLFQIERELFSNSSMGARASISRKLRDLL